MLKALIPIELNLASNIALRYACRKTGILDLGLQPIHVEEPDQEPHSAQSGWIRRTWEAGLEEAGRNEVQRILKGEKLDCFILPKPVVAVGDKEEQTLEELLGGGYDLFVQGAVSNFNQGEFRKLLRSKLFKRMPCPALLVKNLMASDRVVLLLGLETDPERAVRSFCSLLRQEVDFDLCAYAMDERDGDAQALLDKAREHLKAQGRTPAVERVVRGLPEAAAEEFRDYGLMVATMDRKSSRKTPLTDVLGLAACPLLLCW